MKISELKKLGFVEILYFKNIYLLLARYPPHNIHKINIWYDSSTNNFTLNGILLNINSISELKTFLNFFKTK